MRNLTPPPTQYPGANCLPVRKRLWLGGIAMLVFLVTLVAASAAGGPERSLLGGTHGADLIPSYMAGSFVREGRPDKLMSFPASAQFQAHLRRVYGLEQNGRTGPWLNPPWFAGLFVPLSALPFPVALRVWFAFNVILFVLSVVMLCQMLGQRWQTWGLVPLLLVTSMPFIQAIASQQNTFISLFLLTAAVSLWRKGHGLRAGLAAGLLLFKPQLAAVVAVALSCSLGRRAIFGFALSASALIVATAIAMPGALSDYIHKMPSLLPWLQTGRPYAWERQVTFQGFWRLLLQGRVSGPASLPVQLLWISCATAAGAGFLLALHRATHRRANHIPSRGTPGEGQRNGLQPNPFPEHRERAKGPLGNYDRLIAAGIAVMPLVMPYYMDYDLLLLAVPAVLLAGEKCRAQMPFDRAGKWLVAAWAILFPWLFLNAEFGAVTRVSLTVPIMAVMAGLYAYRALTPIASVRALGSTYAVEMNHDPVAIAA